MASKTFIDNDAVAGLVNAEWLNEVDALVWDVFSGVNTLAAARALLYPGIVDSSNGTALTIDVGENVSISNTLTMLDGKFLKFSNGSWLRHSAGHTELYNIVGEIRFTQSNTDNIVLKTGGTKNGITIGGATPVVTLFHNGVEQLKTTVTGINISNVPTTSVGLVSGDVWANAGVLTIIA